MNLLAHSPFLKALGWSLLNSLWQFGAIWLLFYSFIQRSKQLSPAVKHAIALLMISAGFIWFAAGLTAQYFFFPDSSNPVIYIFYASTRYSLIYSTIIYSTIKTFLDNNLTYISLCYLLIVAAFL